MSRDFDGDCDMAERLSAAYHKRIIFWPCPQMKVSRFRLLNFFLLANSKHVYTSKTELDFLRDRTEIRDVRFMRFHFIRRSMCPIIMSIIPLLTLILIQNVFIYDQHLLLHLQENTQHYKRIHLQITVIFVLKRTCVFFPLNSLHSTTFNRVFCSCVQNPLCCIQWIKKNLLWWFLIVF